MRRLARSLPDADSAGRWLFLFGVFLLVSGDFPRFPFGVAERKLVLLVFSWPKLYMVCVCSALLLRLMTRGADLSRLTLARPLYVPFGIVAAAFLLSALFSDRRVLALAGFLYFAEILFFIFAFSVFLDDDGMPRRCVRAVIAAVFFLAARVMAWRWGEGLDVGAYHVMNNSWVGKLQISWALNLFAPIVFTASLGSGDRPWRWGAGLAWAAAAGAVFILFSRAGITAFAAGTAAILIFRARDWRRWVWPAALSVILVLGVAAKSRFMTGYVARTTGRFYEDLGFIRRVSIWKETLGMIRDRPIFGIGLGTYDDLAYTRYRTVNDEASGRRYFRGGWSAHNLLLHVLSETGFVGLAACVYLWFRVARLLLAGGPGGAPPEGRQWSRAALAGLAAFFMLSLTENPMAARVHESLRMNLALWLMVLVCLAMRKEEDV